TQFLLTSEDLFAVGIPAVVKHPLILIRPLLGHVMRRVLSASAIMQVERLVRCDLLGIGDELDRLVGQVLVQGVALFGGLWRLNLVVVVHPVAIVLLGVATYKAVEALESSSPRPAFVRTCS